MDEKEWLSVGNELIGCVKDQFPGAHFNSRIDHSRYSFICNICWKLNTDRDRPNKLSKIISVIISGEAIEDSDYDNNKATIQKKFQDYIETKRKGFDPEHDEPYGQPPPMEEWVITSKHLH
jgi:hypothetical protein